jgi:hypothetical protein
MAFFQPARTSRPCRTRSGNSSIVITADTYTSVLPPGATPVS